VESERLFLESRHASAPAEIAFGVTDLFGGLRRKCRSWPIFGGHVNLNLLYS